MLFAVEASISVGYTTRVVEATLNLAIAQSISMPPINQM